MREIITLQKEIAFKTMIGEITSISLEHDLAFINDCEIEGNLIISGTYKMTEASTLEEEFNYKIPVEIMLTSNLLEENRKLDIKNFTYKIVNEEKLEVNVELLIEGIEKIEIDEDLDEEIIEEDVREIESIEEDLEERKTTLEEIEILKTDESEPFKTDFEPINNLVKEENIKHEEKIEEQDNSIENNEVMDSIFSAFANTRETYSTYSIYILREDDNIDEIISKYKITRDELTEYNDLENLKVGTKLIIPTTITETND